MRDFVYDEEREKLSKLEKEKLIQKRDEMRVSLSSKKQSLHF